jgi:hypothetical protein
MPIRNFLRKIKLTFILLLNELKNSLAHLIKEIEHF